MEYMKPFLTWFNGHLKLLQRYGGRESAALAVPVCEHLVTWSAAVECKQGGQNHFVVPIALVAGHGSNTLQG